MLKIYFGDMPEAIYNTEIYFKNTYQEDWITDDFAREIIKGVESLGFKMDAEKNAAHFGKKGIVSTDDSKGKVIIMPTNEELMIAKSTVQVLKLA